jgi:hypothetical protein
MTTSPRRRAPPPVCANCGERLKGPWCHACGQHAAGLHRSVKQVAIEWAEGLTHLDQRARATLPDLVLKPARLTNAYLEGRRAPQMPPLRMFLVVLVMVFAAGSLGDALRAQRHASPMFTYVGLTPATGLGRPGVAFADLTPAQRSELHWTIDTLKAPWLQRQLHRAADNPKGFAQAYSRWSRQLAFALLPIGAAILCLMFVRRREVTVYDHLIFAMHSLSFQGVLFSLTELVAILPHAPALLLPLFAPVHLFVHMRGVYRTGVIGTLLRVAALGLAAALSFVLLVMLAVSAVLAEMAEVAA